MSQAWLVFVIPVVLSLLVNEVCDISPWLADKLVRRAARWWARSDEGRVADEIEAEWAAIVECAPGKLTKLGVAVKFAIGAQWEFQQYQLAQYMAVATSFVMPLVLRLSPQHRRRARADRLRRELYNYYWEALKNNHHLPRPVIASPQTEGNIYRMALARNKYRRKTAGTSVTGGTSETNRSSSSAPAESGSARAARPPRL